MRSETSSVQSSGSFSNKKKEEEEEELYIHGTGSSVVLSSAEGMDGGCHVCMKFRQSIYFKTPRWSC